MPKLKPSDIPGLVIVAAILAYTLYFTLTHPNMKPASNFGPEWKCFGEGKGTAGFCIKKDLLAPHAKP